METLIYLKKELESLFKMERETGVEPEGPEKKANCFAFSDPQADGDVCEVNRHTALRSGFKNMETLIYLKKELESLFKMERETGVEPATPTLARSCSTTELLPHLKMVPRAGIEPARANAHQILSLACLPVSPPRLLVCL